MFRTGSRLAVRHTPDGLVFVLEQLLVRERVDEVFGKVERLIWARSVVLSHVFTQRLRRRRGHPSQIEPHGRSVGAPREPWRTTSISTRRFFGGAVADEDPRSIVAVTSPIAMPWTGASKRGNTRGSVEWSVCGHRYGHERHSVRPPRAPAAGLSYEVQAKVTQLVASAWRAQSRVKAALACQGEARGRAARWGVRRMSTCLALSDFFFTFPLGVSG